MKRLLLPHQTKTKPLLYFRQIVNLLSVLIGTPPHPTLYLFSVVAHRCRPLFHEFSSLRALIRVLTKSGDPERQKKKNTVALQVNKKRSLFGLRQDRMCGARFPKVQRNLSFKYANPCFSGCFVAFSWMKRATSNSRVSPLVTHHGETSLSPGICWQTWNHVIDYTFIYFPPIYPP